MDLEGDQIVGVDKYPVSHRGMAYGARPAPCWVRQKNEARAVLRITILERAVVNGSPARALDGGLHGPLAVSPTIHGGAAQGACFVDNTETVNDTPTQRDALVKVPCVL
jgi:hypothetical protein